MTCFSHDMAVPLFLIEYHEMAFLKKIESIPNLSILKGATRAVKVDYLHRCFEDIAEKSSAATALIYEDGSQIRKSSYKELNEGANKIARYLCKTIKNENILSNNDGDYIIVVCMPPLDDMVKILMAILKAGCACLPIDPSFPQRRIDHIIREAKPAIVVYSEDIFSFGTTKKVSIEELFKYSNNYNDSNLLDSDCMRSLKDDLAITLYTSGSTGVPKGVRLPHRAILNRLQWQFKTFPYSKTEHCCIFKTPLTFFDSISEIFGPLTTGLSVLVIPKSVTVDPEKLIGTLEKYKVERLVLVPSLLKSLLLYLQVQENKGHLSNLKIWVCSGETLVVSLALEFFQYFPENDHILCNFYGSTEISGDVSYHIIRNGAPLENASYVPIGVPVDNTILYLLDKDNKPVRAGEVGELFVSGLNLSAGYVNSRDPERFIYNPLAIDPMYSRMFKTGDFARLEKDSLVFEGRADSQVKIRGHRVDLSEVEKAVASIPEIEKCVVLCYKPGENNQMLLAFVKTNALLSENQLEIILREKLMAYMVPQVVLIESIPLLVNGKIDRQALSKIYENTNNNDDDYFQVEIDYSGVPQHQFEAAKILFETVSTILCRSARSSIHMGANFYDIGGNSLNSILTITSLKRKGYYISIGDFIGAKDFREILDKMIQSNSSDARVSLALDSSHYRAEPLCDKYKNEVIDMVASSFCFCKKADLKQSIFPKIALADYFDLIDFIWKPLIDKKLSFVVLLEDKCVGVTLNFDAHDKPDVLVKSKLRIVFEFLEFVEGPIRDNELPNKVGDVLHSSMMATHSSLSSKENVEAMHFMENEVVKLAKTRKFKGILATNTSPLTQQLGNDVYGYKVMNDYQINLYEASDKTKPFAAASDDQRAIVHWKEI